MFKVTFSNTGAGVEVEEGAELKDVAKKNDWPIAFGCEDGVCGTCIVEVEEGGETLNDVDDVEGQTLEMMMMKDGKHRLACKCKVNGDIKIKSV